MFLVYVVGFDIVYDDNFGAKNIRFVLGVGSVKINDPTPRESPKSDSDATIPYEEHIFSKIVTIKCARSKQELQTYYP